MKNLVAKLNILIGVFQSILAILLLTTIAPKLHNLYQDVNYENNSLYIYPLVLLGWGAISIINSLIELRVIKLKEKSDLKAFHKSGNYILVISFLLTGLLVGLTVLSMITPLYSITSSL